MNFLQDMVSGPDGHASSKRMMAIIAFCLMIQAVEMNLYENVKMDPTLQNFLLIMILGLSGAATVENLSAKKTASATKTVTTTAETKEVKTDPPPKT